MVATACVVMVVFARQAEAQSFDLTAFLDKADHATAQYQSTFKNLTAEEQKTFDYFRADGSLDESRKIKSVFIIYQSPKTHLVAEFRNVTEFNGKNVSRSDSSIARFFAKLAHADSSTEEISRLRKEGNRFDGKSESYGMTLIQAFVLNRFFRPFFEFQVVGRERIEDRDVIVVEYHQTKPTLSIKANATDDERKAEPSGISFDTELPDRFRPTNPRLHGKLWLDAETGQLWRNEFDVTIQPAPREQPIVSSSFALEYRSSEFGILLPKRLSSIGYRFSSKNGRDLERTKAATKTFEYSKFSKSDSEIKDVKTTN